MKSERMSRVRPFNGFPRNTEAKKGFVVKKCKDCNESIFVPFNQLGDMPNICRECYM